MSRDYKNAGTGRGPRTAGSGFLPFLAGLSIGLLVAFGVIVYQLDWHVGGPGQKAPQTAKEGVAKATKRSDKPAAALPQPKFDFYRILPNREVNISEWVADEGTGAPPPAGEEAGVLVLQVGSFKTFDAADQIKAQLALLGIEADIQRVVINGQDIRHRVRIGPYRDAQALEQTRRRLKENGLDFMVLKLGQETADR